MFETTYQSVSSTHPEWGKVAILPWDADIFGFPVAEYKIGDMKSIGKTLTDFQNALTEWASSNRVELISCSVPADDPALKALMSWSGFSFIDYTLQINRKKLQTADLPVGRFPIRLVKPSDQSQVEQVAENAFKFVRYHSDARFPRDLADFRYRHWIRNTFASLGDTSRMYVTESEGRVTGFFHVALDRESAYIAIIAVDRALQHRQVAFDLCAGSMNELKRIGIHRVTAKISTANTALMNLANFWGFRFSSPQLTFHWHAPNAAHLLTWESIFA